MQLCWITITVRDFEQSLAFYRDLIGLPVNRRMKPMPGMEIAFLGEGSTELELIYSDKNSAAGPGEDVSVGFTVESVEETMKLLASKNISIHSGPFQPNPFIKFVYALDPNGLKIQFVEKVKA